MPKFEIRFDDHVSSLLGAVARALEDKATPEVAEQLRRNPGLLIASGLDLAGAQRTLVIRLEPGPGLVAAARLLGIVQEKPRKLAFASREPGSPPTAE